MPRTALHVLIWSRDQGFYELYTQGQFVQRFQPGEEAWLAWLRDVSSFAFQGICGSLNVYQENRSRGGRYWYAYHTTRGRTRKRYLGQSVMVTLTRLEEIAMALSNKNEPASTSASLFLKQSEVKIESDQTSPLEAHKFEQKDVVLLTRLSPPRSPIALVGRERLLRDLDEALSHRLTLVSASAGSGKTTMLSSWVAASSHQQTKGNEHRIAWLSLDELDNTTTRFWGSVIAALRTCKTSTGEVALSMLHSPQPPPLSTILTHLLNEVADWQNEAILILDDYHVIGDQTIHESLLFLLDHLPDNLHLVLSSRIDPAFPLSRLRVRGQMTEIRDSDLRFTREETTSFLLQRMGLPLSEEDVAALEQRTEGWIAGLQLVALSIHKHENRPAFLQAFSGGQRYLLDYVQEEILERLEASQRDFLLQASILSQMSAAICQAITEEPESRICQEMLLFLERSNLFLIPLDEERRWYRLHDLFREALQARLCATQPAIVPILHQRAARWYEMQGEWRAAIFHALSAGDFSYAAHMMEQSAEQFWLRGEAATVYRWIIVLPDTVAYEHANLVLTTLLHLLLQAPTFYYGEEVAWRGILLQAEQTMTWLEKILKHQEGHLSSVAQETLIHRRIQLLRAYIEIREAIWKSDTERLRIIDQQVRDIAEDDDIIWNMVSLFITFALHIPPLGDGKVDILISAAQPIKQKALEGGDHFTALKVIQWLAHAYMLAGQFQQVLQECLPAFAIAKQVGSSFSSVAWLHYSHAYVCYRRNQLPEARSSLEIVLRHARDWQHVEMQVNGYELLARIALAQGELNEAQGALQELENFNQRQELLPYHILILTAIRVQFWLECGDLDRASAWSMQEAHTLHKLAEEDRPLLPEEYQLLTLLVRLYIDQQYYLQAKTLLECVIVKVEHEQQSEFLASFLALHVISLFFTEKREQAILVATRLFALAKPEGYIRVYLDAGKPLKQALLMLQAASRGRLDSALLDYRSYISRLLIIFEQEEQKQALRAFSENTLSQEAPLLPPGTSTASSSTPVLLEPLTTQELRVLRLLVIGRTYTEIAQTLIVSLNTIKTQVSSIYRKLAVSRRAEAIAQAQRLRLL